MRTMPLPHDPLPMRELIAFIACVVGVAALYVTGQVPLTGPVVAMQIVAWVGGALFVLLVQRRADQ